MNPGNPLTVDRHYLTHQKTENYRDADYTIPDKLISLFQADQLEGNPVPAYSAAAMIYRSGRSSSRLPEIIR